MWLETKTNDLQSSCLASATATATVTALTTAAAAATAAAGSIVAAAAAAAVSSEPSKNLRHSASFSCLSRTNAVASQMSASVMTDDSAYRGRTATLPAAVADLDYGFIVHPSATVAHMPSDLSISYSNCGSVPPEESSVSSSITESVTMVPAISQIDLSKADRSNISRKVLIKKSVSLLNPNLWWTPKFRRMKSNKNKDKNVPEIQSQKRWRSLGALLRVSGANGSHPLATVQSSLPAQSFYLLEDFLKPSTAAQHDEDNNTRDNSSTSLHLPLTTVSRVPPCSIRTRNLPSENTSSVATAASASTTTSVIDCCSLCKRCRSRDAPLSTFDPSALVSKFVFVSCAYIIYFLVIIILVYRKSSTYVVTLTNW